MDLGRHATRQRKKKTRTPTTLTIESGTMMSFPLKTMTRVTSRSFIDERQKEIKKPGDGIQNALLDGEENEIEDKTIMTRVRSRSHSAEREKGMKAPSVALQDKTKGKENNTRAKATMLTLPIGIRTRVKSLSFREERRE